MGIDWLRLCVCDGDFVVDVIALISDPAWQITLPLGRTIIVFNEHFDLAKRVPHEGCRHGRYHHTASRDQRNVTWWTALLN